MSSSARLRLLLVDDHTLFRKGLASLLRAEPDFEVVGEAADGPEAVEKASALCPDIILMDLHMPRMSGLEAARSILSMRPDAKIVMLTISEDTEVILEAVKSGAWGYLLKTVEPSALLGLLRGVGRGEAALSSDLAARIMREFAERARRPPTAHSSMAQLTPREQDVLAGVSRGRSNKEIATALAIAENTVKSTLARILEKLHLDNRVQAAIYAISHGLPDEAGGPDLPADRSSSRRPG